MSVQVDHERHVGDLMEAEIDVSGCAGHAAFDEQARAPDPRQVERAAGKAAGDLPADDGCQRVELATPAEGMS